MRNRTKKVKFQVRDYSNCTYRQLVDFVENTNKELYSYMDLPEGYEKFQLMLKCLLELDQIVREQIKRGGIAQFKAVDVLNEQKRPELN